MDINLSEWALIKLSQIEGDFHGFDPEKVFYLSDGTYYYQKNDKRVSHYAYKPNVYIYQNDSTQIMIVEGLEDYVEVELYKG